jgi:hypothetical protein
MEGLVTNKAFHFCRKNYMAYSEPHHSNQKETAMYLNDFQNFVFVIISSLGFIAAVYTLAIIEEKIRAIVAKRAVKTTTKSRTVASNTYDPFTEFKF